MRDTNSWVHGWCGLVRTGAGLALTAGLELASNTALKSAAVAGAGAVVVSRLALAHELDDGTLVRVQVRGIDLRRSLTAIWRRDEELSEAAVALFGTARRSESTARRSPEQQAGARG